jgi:hypothetical protein
LTQQPLDHLHPPAQHPKSSKISLPEEKWPAEGKPRKNKHKKNPPQKMNYAVRPDAR